MKYRLSFVLLFIVSSLNAQKTPTLLIDGTPIKFQSDLSLPYWVNAGKTVAFSVDAISASVLEFNINSNELQFNQVLHLTTSGTVPAGKAWKIEAIGLGPNSSETPTNGFSTAATPTIFTSPITYSTAGTYSWIVPPGVTNICIEAWGAGGNGGNGISTGGGGAGGGGGAYGYSCFTVVPGTNYTVTVGASGQASSLGTLIIANGGVNGTNATSPTVNGTFGAGGTSNASFSIIGNNGSGYNGGCNQTNSARGGKGANGGSGGSGALRFGSSCSDYTPAQNGVFPGGGGGGGNGNASYTAGGAGANGQIIIYF
jgi:hypothetical protein